MLLLLWRATRLRCPRCGVGKLYRKGFKMYDACGSCGWVFEREEGYWTGAMAINLVVAELLIFLLVVPMLVAQAPVALTVVLGVAMAGLAPLLFYRHSKSYWMAIDFLVHPTPLLHGGRLRTMSELQSQLGAPPTVASRTPSPSPRQLSGQEAAL